jgi:hypothetical protein
MHAPIPELRQWPRREGGTVDNAKMVAATGKCERGRPCQRAGSGGDRGGWSNRGQGRATERREKSGDVATIERAGGIDTVTEVDLINNTVDRPMHIKCHTPVSEMSTWADLRVAPTLMIQQLPESWETSTNTVPYTHTSE